MITYKQIAEALEYHLSYGTDVQKLSGVRGIIALLKRCEGTPSN